MKKLLRLNYGCGENKLEGFVNIDSEKGVKPDLKWDATKKPLPYKDNSVSEIYCLHNIEHIPLGSWVPLFQEFWRVLKRDGDLILSYPEWDICAKYYQENHRGQRAFWRACLYGRQLWPGDFHVTPVHSGELASFLQRFGFKSIKTGPDKFQPQYSYLKCKKGAAITTRADVLKKEIFGDANIYDTQRANQTKFRSS